MIVMNDLALSRNLGPLMIDISLDNNLTWAKINSPQGFVMIGQYLWVVNGPVSHITLAKTRHGPDWRRQTWAGSGTTLTFRTWNIFFLRIYA